MSKSLTLEDGSQLPFLPKDLKYYIDQTTLIYGRRKSGKSVLVEEIMYICRDMVSMVFVISQSSITNKSFRGKVPDSCILTSITPEWIENFVQTQQHRVDFYNTANDMGVLAGLFKRIPSIKNAQTQETGIIQSYLKGIKEIDDSPMNFANKKQQKDRITTLRNKYLFQLYKQMIRKNKNYLQSIQDLNTEEICCIQYLDFRPHVMLIFDDCASILKKWVKESSKIKEIFYNGRHYNITLIITSQDDKDIDSELRKNSMISIFTTHQAAQANFERGANSYPRYEKIRASHCVKSVFRPTPGFQNHSKLVYVQGDDDDPFYYTIADIYPDFRMGCESLWKIDEKIREERQRQGNNRANTDEFFRKYHNM